MKNIVCILASVVAFGYAPATALAQASCSSDGALRPTAVFERFISADCEACWSDHAVPAPSATGGAVVLDWIVPGALGDDAPLSAAATRDALDRLESLGRRPPTRTDVYTAAVETAASGPRLRVAHGIPFNDYVGASIHFAPQRSSAESHGAAMGDLHYYLVLVEAVPAGTDGTAVPRNIVRNMLQGTWNKRNALSKKEQSIQWMEARSMRIPEGVQAERLRMVGWVQDAQGRTVAAAQSTCQ
ncbi:MAG: hypothetical protein EOO27_40170 [Comamonadaceae bacterium]|nr:MAG: hypothetical protein EOO27_40170 [Comamonadaceae bacterium]